MRRHVGKQPLVRRAESTRLIARDVGQQVDVEPRLRLPSRAEAHECVVDRRCQLLQLRPGDDEGGRDLQPAVDQCPAEHPALAQRPEEPGHHGGVVGQHLGRQLHRGKQAAAPTHVRYPGVRPQG